MKYDLIVYGGGTAGVSAAYIAAKKGLKTLLIEQTDSLGGAITQGLVVPSMKVDTENINTEFISDLKIFTDKYSARHTYSDGNEFWFNPQLLKNALDDMLNSVNCEVLFSSYPIDINFNHNLELYENFISHKTLSVYIESKYIIDATSEGKIFKLLNCEFQNKAENFQTPTLRFIISGIDMPKFADWLENFDTDRNVTTVERTQNQIYLSSACTWDKRKWALRPLFDEAVRDNVLEYEDTAYFQVFSMPSMPDALNFNAPRILLSDDEDLADPFVYSRALMQGRERIFRLYNFCKKYFPGFENSYISQTASMLGVRESNRVKCLYTVTTDDIIHPKQFENVAFACNYPIDIHSNSNTKDKLEHVNHTYYVPIEALISKDYDNLYAVGRIISAEFEAQAALRTQMSSFSMGEAAAKDIVKKIK